MQDYHRREKRSYDKIRTLFFTEKEKLENESRALQEKIELENALNKKASEELKKKLEDDGKAIFDRISDESNQLKDNIENQGKQMLNTMNQENEARKLEADQIKKKWSEKRKNSKLTLKMIRRI